MKGRGRVLILAATEMEIEPLLKISTILSDTVFHGTARVITARLSDMVFTLNITGIGVINTAHAVTRAIGDQMPEIIIQAGIGGAFEGAGISLGDIAVAESDTYIHTGVEERWGREEGTLTPSYPHAALPFDLIENQPATRQGRFFFNPDICCRACSIIKSHAVFEKGYEGVKVICGDFITVSTITATAWRTSALFNAFSPCMESMEGAAAAHVASLYNIPFVEIRAASNIVGIRDKSQWNIPLAVKRTCLALTALLKKGDGFWTTTQQ